MTFAEVLHFIHAALYRATHQADVSAIRRAVMLYMKGGNAVKEVAKTGH